MESLEEGGATGQTQHQGAQLIYNSIALKSPRETVLITVYLVCIAEKPRKLNEINMQRPVKQTQTYRQSMM